MLSSSLYGWLPKAENERYQASQANGHTHDSTGPGISTTLSWCPKKAARLKSRGPSRQTSELVRQDFLEMLLTGLGVGGAAVFEALEIALFTVGDALFPTGKEDPDPLESQRSHRDMMSFALGQLSLIETLGPGASGDRTTGKLVKGLAQELRASVADTHRLYNGEKRRRRSSAIS